MWKIIFTLHLYCIAIGLCTNSIDNNIDSIFLSDIRSDNKLHAVGPLKFLPCSVCGPAVFANTAVVISHLIWPCNIAVCITYLISHSLINAKLPLFVDIIHQTAPAGAMKTLVLRTRASRAPAVKTS